MRLLLDSNILYWTLLYPDRIGRRVADLLEDPAHEHWVSAISFAEFQIKASIGKLKLPERLLNETIALGFDLLPFRPEHAHWLSGLPFHHRDPFDRMLIAQAMEEGMTILTADSTITRYAVTTIRN